MANYLCIFVVCEWKIGNLQESNGEKTKQIENNNDANTQTQTTQTHAYNESNNNVSANVIAFNRANNIDINNGDNVPRQTSRGRGRSALLIPVVLPGGINSSINISTAHGPQ